MLGGACVEAPDVARHDAKAGVGPGQQVCYHVTWEAGFCNLTSVASLLPLSQSVGCPGSLEFYCILPPTPTLSDLNLKNKVFSGQR